MSKKILVAYDGSDLSDKAIQEVKEVTAHIPKVEVHIVSVAEITGPSTNKVMNDSITNEITEETNQKLQEVKKAFNKENVDVITKVFISEKKNNPGNEICEYAKINEIGMIIVGSRGLGNIKGAFLGSVSNKIIKDAHCPVLVVK